ncbi:hypothetical protein SCHPADRAFT_598035 [Schizopora paradoxa]|uniref:F-box domain-containing protein n=1 Tax=Schizopora paradoxa TaxID=27342 RepID=A0A0H2RBB9_9AGAM|nr:hypothetical protein SCHPADRAFT_598035 [Schizopora paradoxa]
MYALTKWLPLAPNLQELEVTMSFDRFDAYTAGPNDRIWKAAARGTTETPHFVLPTLRTLSAWAALIRNFTCPALERYVMEKFTRHDKYLTDYLEFVKRSGAPPSFRTLEIRSSENSPVLGYFLSTITNLLITSPDKSIFTVFSERSQGDGVLGFVILPALEYLEITNCRDDCLPHLSSLVTSRWDICIAHRTLKSLKLIQCFASSPVPELLLSPPTGGIDLTQVGDNWREIARCVNEGLLLSI